MTTILDQLQNELRLQLSFYTVSGYTNVHRPGQPIRVGDVIEFSIDARNNSSLTMSNIGAVFSSSRAIQLVDANDTMIGQSLDGLVIPELLPGNSDHVLENVRAKVLQQLPIFHFTLDHLGSIVANGSANLAELHFMDQAFFAADIRAA